jgi:cell division transport system ATP-binding protein
MIKLIDVSKQYGDNFGLSDINIKIDDGEFVFLVGPSGAGKSTFIKLILKEIDPDKGSIIFDDYEVTSLSNRMVPQYRRNIGIVFQDFRLLPKMTVYENVAFAMEAVHQKKKLIKKQVPHILNLVGISEKADRYPNELSGGEAQRVAIARAIVNNPKVLIADEPTGNLDPEKSWEIMNLLNQINLRGTTIVMVTHAKEIVDKMEKRVVQIEKGRIVRDDKSGFYVEDAAKALHNEISSKESRFEEKAKEHRYQERLKRLGIKNTSPATTRFTTEELIQQATEIEQHVEDEGGEVFD